MLERGGGAHGIRLATGRHPCPGHYGGDEGRHEEEQDDDGRDVGAVPRRAVDGRRCGAVGAVGEAAGDWPRVTFRHAVAHPGADEVA